MHTKIKNTMWLVFTLLICCEGGVQIQGCEGIDTTYNFPREKALSNILKVRLTHAGADFIETHARDILMAAFGVNQDGFAEIPIGDIDFPIEILGIGIATIHIRQAVATVDFDSLDLTLAEADEGRAKIIIKMEHAKFGIDAEMRGIEIPFDDAACRIENGISPSEAGELSFEAAIYLKVDEDRNFNSEVEIESIDIHELHINIVTQCGLSPECTDLSNPLDNNPCFECQAVCGASNIGAEVAFWFRDLLDNAIDGLLRGPLELAVNNLLDEFNGQPLEIEGAISPSRLLEGFLPLSFSAQPLGFLVTPTEDGFVVSGEGEAGGLDMLFNGGTDSEQHGCAPPAPMPFYTSGPFPELTGIDSQGNIYHLASALSHSFLNQLGYALYTGGALCVDLSTLDIYELSEQQFLLNAGTITLLAPELKDIVSSSSGVFIQLNPTSPPTITLGSGEVIDTDNEGNPVVENLIRVEINHIGISFYLFIEERHTRVFQVFSDATIGISITPEANGNISITIGEISIENIEEGYNELVPDAEIENVMEVILSIAMGVLADSATSLSLNIDEVLSSALSVPISITINEIKRDGREENFLTTLITFREVQH